MLTSIVPINQGNRISQFHVWYMGRGVSYDNYARFKEPENTSFTSANAFGAGAITF